MCRLLYVKNPSLDFLNNLTAFLSYLEIKRGGHGNGVGALIKTKKKKAWWIRKGLRYDVFRASKDIKKLLPKSINGVMFHTRLSSSFTKITSELNHPFATVNLMLIHNGGDAGRVKIISELTRRGIKLPKIYSDTLLLTILADIWYDETLSETITVKRIFDIINPVNAIFVQFYKTGNVYLIVKHQDFQLYYDSETVIVASEGLEEYFDEIYTCDECIIKVEENGEPKTIYGFINSNNYVEEEDIDLDTYDYYSQLLWKEKEYM